MNTYCRYIFALLLAVAATSSFGADLLTVGNPAPPLEVSMFLKGVPVKN